MRKSDRIYALAGTVAFHVVLLLVLLFSFLRFPPEGADEWPEEPRPEIVFEEMEELYAAGEFVRTGDNMAEYVPDDEPAPSDVSNPEPTQDAADAANAGKAADPAPALTSKQPSPAKTEQKPKGPTKEEIAAEKARQEAKKQQQTKKNVDAATARAFGGGKGATTAGSAEGNSATGSVTGTPGNGLKGRSLEKWTSVRGRKLGSITVNVKVDSQGRVVNATYNAARSSGTVSADENMRRQCVARSKECRFSVLEGSPVQSGTITWTFK